MISNWVFNERTLRCDEAAIEGYKVEIGGSIENSFMFIKIKDKIRINGDII